MADTIVWTKKTVIGDLRFQTGVITAGGGAVATGLKNITDAMICAMTSMNTGGDKTLFINGAASGVGDIKIGSGTAGDDHRLWVLGT